MMTYTFESPVNVDVTSGYKMFMDGFVASDFINNALDIDGTDLTEFLVDDLAKVVTDITIETRCNYEGKIIARTTCTCNEKLTEKQLNALSDFLSGQFSDGWGEWFEQEELNLGNATQGYVSLWSPENNWKIEVVGYSTCE